MHCTLSPVCAMLGQPTRSHNLLLLLIDATRAKENPRQAGKRNGGVDRDEGTNAFIGGDSMIPLGPLSTRHPFTNLKSEALGMSQGKRHYISNLRWFLCSKIIQIFLIAYFQNFSPSHPIFTNFAVPAYHLRYFYWIFPLQRHFYLGSS